MTPRRKLAGQPVLPTGAAVAFRVKARPTGWTSAVLVVTFLLPCGASFPPVVHFGALALTLAVAVGFTVLPAALTGNRKPGPPPV
jgi:hypothetical protein